MLLQPISGLLPSAQNSSKERTDRKCQLHVLPGIQKEQLIF